MLFIQIKPKGIHALIIKSARSSKKLPVMFIAGNKAKVQIHFDIDYENPDYEKYPALRHLKGFEAELNHGDVLYVPPGWWHFISYEEIVFSMAIRAFPRDIKNILKCCATYSGHEL